MSVIDVSCQGGPTDRSNTAESHWYALYTVSRHEKAVARQLSLKAIDHYLPLYQCYNQWKDRRVRIASPLFPGYVFVRIAFTQRVQVLQTSGVVRIVGFNGRPTPLPEGEIEALQKYLAVRRAEPLPYLTAGKRVLVRSGPLAGLYGVVLRRKGELRIVICVESIQRSIALELEAADVQAAT